MTDAPKRCDRKPRPHFCALVERAVAGRLATWWGDVREGVSTLMHRSSGGRPYRGVGRR